MLLRYFTRVFVSSLLAITLMGPVLLFHLQPAGAIQPDPTPRPVMTGDYNGYPLFQTDLREFTGDVARPNGMIWLNDEIFVVCAGDQTVYKLYGTSGVTDTYIYGVTDAHMLYAEDTGNLGVHLWVPDSRAGRLLRITPAGVDVIVSGMLGAWGISYLDPATFLISNRLRGIVETVTRTGQRTTRVEGLALPTGLDHDNQYLYVANSGDPDRAVEWYPLSTGPDSEPASNPALIRGLTRVMAVRIGPDGNLYFAYEEEGQGVIGRVNPDQCRINGGCSADEVEPIIVTTLAAPLAGLTFSPDGRLFLHERYGESLYWAQVVN